MADPVIEHPFLPGVKVARVRRNIYGRGTGTVERSEVKTLIRKGKRAGRFTVKAWDVEHEAIIPNDGRWTARCLGWNRGMVYLDDNYVAEIEKGFQFAEGVEHLKHLAATITNYVQKTARDVTPETLQRDVELLKRLIETFTQGADARASERV